MNKKINALTISYILFLIILFLSGSFSGILSRLIYILSGLIPFVLCLFLTRGELDGAKWRLLTVKKDNLKLALPLFAPTVVSIILLSFVTSWLIFKLTGKENHVNIGNSYVLAIINHALLPAIIEEALFRYLPIRLLSSHSRRAAVFVSAFFFALVHRNLFTIPYAFLAGVIFMAIDLATDSVIPSLLLHFINNSISVGLIFYEKNTAFAPTVYAILGILCFISILVIVKKRREYKKMLTLPFLKGEKMKFSFEMLIFAGLTLAIAIMNIL